MKRLLLSLFATLALGATLSSAYGESLQSKMRDKPLLAPLTAEPEVPDPERVFRVSARVIDAGTVGLHFDIDECCYLYRDKMKIELVTADGALTGAPDGAGLGAFTLPAGKVKTDEFIGRTEIYHGPGPVDAKLPLQPGAGADLTKLAIKVTYQGCAEKPIAICYPPITKILALDPDRGGLTGSSSTAGAAGKSVGGAAFLLALLAAFGAGLLLSFTPCVLPMIPILSGAIVETEGAQLTKLRGGLLSYVYVFGTAVTYAVAGAVAGATGEQLQAYFQNPWAIGVFSAILALLALSMFGIYELQIPSAIQSLLHHHSTKLRGHARHWLAGEMIGVFVLGLFSALIIGACVSPVLVSVLAGAIATHDPVLGAGILFALAHGQGAILIAVGIGSGVLLPKAGPWMDTVKHVFGALLLATAVYLLGVLPEVPVLILWGVLFIVGAVYLGATQRLPDGASGWRYLWKGLGTVLLVWGVLALIGGLAGNRDLLNPLSSMLSANKTAPVAPSELFDRVRSLAEIETRLAGAKAAGKPAILDYYADWCTDCRRMEKATFADPEVRAELARRFVLIQANVTQSDDPEIKKLKSRFNVYGPPAMLLFSSAGTEREELRTYGFLDKPAFLALLRRID